MHEHSDTFLASVKSLRSDNLAFDFNIYVEDSTFPVHRLVLIAFSDYFRAMLLHDTKEAQEGKVDLKGMRAIAVKECIEYMYNGKCSVDIDTLEEILKSGNILQLNGVKEICFNYMRSNLSYSNCVFFLGLLEMFKNEAVADKVRKFFQGEFLEVGDSDDFKELGWQIVRKYLYEFSADDLETWSVGINWIKYDEPSREREIYELVKLLRLFKYPSIALLSSMWDESLFTSHAECVDHVHRRIFADISDLKMNLQLNNCIFLSVQAHQYKRIGRLIMPSIVQYMKNHLRSILVMTDDFSKIHRDELEVLISAKDTDYFSEAAKWNVLVSWIDSNSSDEDVFTELFVSIDLNSISNRYLNENIVSHRLFKNPTHNIDLAKRLVAREEPINDSIAVILGNKYLGKIDIMMGVVQIVSVVPDHITVTNPRLVSCSTKVCLFSKSHLYCLNNDNKWAVLSSSVSTTSEEENVCLCELLDCIFIVTKTRLFKYNPLEDKRTIYRGCSFVTFTATSSRNYLYVMNGGSNREIKRFDPVECEWTQFSKSPSMCTEQTILYVVDNLYIHDDSKWFSFLPSTGMWHPMSSTSTSMCLDLNKNGLTTIAHKVFAVIPSRYCNDLTLTILDLLNEKATEKNFSFNTPGTIRNDLSVTAACAFRFRKSNLDLHAFTKRSKVMI